MAKARIQFCTECRKDTTYQMKHVSCKKCIKEKEYVFDILEAVCEHCGQRINISGLMDYNAKAIDKQYRLKENIVSCEDIYHLMAIYNIGKAPLSLALGFGEITITRYLAGQIPSKDYSDIIRMSLESPVYMMKKLQENADKIGETAYRKAMNAAEELRPLFNLSDKMLLTISYIFNRAEEVTPLALQKILYYIQGIYMVLFDTELFTEECEAWAHGPVYRDVYDVFKNFKYNPIDDTRFAILQNRFHELSNDEKRVIDLVVESFGRYSGKVLERITHEEPPWKDARVNCLPGEFPNEVISKEVIKTYFASVAKEYDLSELDGINEYIEQRLQICTM